MGSGIIVREIEITQEHVNELTSATKDQLVHAWKIARGRSVRTTKEQRDYNEALMIFINQLRHKIDQEELAEKLAREGLAEGDSAFLDEDTEIGLGFDDEISADAKEVKQASDDEENDLVIE
jgi:hypothetical protein